MGETDRYFDSEADRNRTLNDSAVKVVEAVGIEHRAIHLVQTIL